ncbi:nucleoside hydrolase [Consotaella salsifontis]|uniref:Purine nucleosidase n=1 Tax=Consotaella salsifontis TaxID=1365950 RepID=A0A1T4SVL3_9HYPH|nr:nucleoside hydrolase [Consotaella salsifontis]SKA31941.1 purine nucleosidase [Consotaella salsifontis]
MTARSVILDADPGVDDMGAILLALASPELDVEAVCAVAGNVPVEATVRNALKTVALAGQPGIPVLRGSARPLVAEQVLGKHAAVGVFPDDIVPPTEIDPQSGSAALFIAERAIVAARDGRRLSICASGPLTDIALALTMDARVARGIERIAIMGGAFTALGNRRPFAEFNMLADPHAAASVFASGVAVTLFPLDVTQQALLQDHHLATLRASCGAAGKALAAMFEFSDRGNLARYGRPGGPIHDIMPVAFLIAPDLFTLRPAVLGIETGGSTAGHTFADFDAPAGDVPVAEIAVAVDEERLFALLLGRLSAYGEREKAQSETRS